MFSLKLIRTLQLLAVSVFLASADISLTCQNENTALSCGAGQIIITGVKYGRTDSSTCTFQQDPSRLSNTSCNTCSLYPTVFASCQGQSSCLLQASSTLDPCSDTYKYLNVSYYCVSSGTQTSASCESQRSELTCGQGTISVISANFGRTSTTTCSAGRPADQVQNTNCHAPNSLSRVREWCQGKNSCVVQASATYFSDPCGGTYKYLSVTYACVY